MNELHDPIYVIVPEDSFRFHYVNTATCEHFGRTETELLQMSIPDWDPNFQWSDCDEFWAKIKVEKKITFETLHKVKSGEVIPVEVSASYLKFAGVEYLGGFIKNMSSRKKSEAEIKNLAENLARSNDELKQFAYVASHDLREPLRTVASFVQLLEREYAPKLDGRAIEFIHLCVQGVDRMKRLIDALLEYSKVEQGAFSVKRMDSMKVMSQIRDNLKVAIYEAKADLHFSDLPMVKGDEIQLIQLFQNLVSNAIKFRNKKSAKIFVSARESDSEIIFSVRDNGIGIDEKYGERVFQIFQKLHTDDEYVGAGLGLAICKKIVQNHRGRIWFESIPGVETTFFVGLPKS